MGDHEVGEVEVVEGEEGDIFAESFAELAHGAHGLHGREEVEADDGVGAVALEHDFGEPFGRDLAFAVDGAGERFEAGFLHGFVVAGEALAAGVESGAGADGDDSFVAVAEEMLHGFFGAAAVWNGDEVVACAVDGFVVGDDGEVGWDDAADVVAAVVRGRDDEAVDLAAYEALDLGAFDVAVEAGAGEDDDVAVGACGFLHGFDGVGCEWIGDVGDDHSNGGGAAGFEATGELVRLVAEAGHGRSNARGRFFADVGFVAEYA